MGNPLGIAVHALHEEPVVVVTDFDVCHLPEAVALLTKFGRKYIADFDSQLVAALTEVDEK